MDFIDGFNDNMMPALLDSLGDDLRFLVPGLPVTIKCIPVISGGESSGTGWADDIFARLDVTSKMFQGMEKDFIAVDEGCQVIYLNKAWLLSEIIQNNDGTVLLILVPDSHVAHAGSDWQ